MHPYSSDSRNGRLAPLVIAVAAILLAWCLSAVLSALDATPPWWLDTPAVVGFYGMLWNLWDRSLWRLGGRRRNLSGVLNVSGTWEGKIISSYGGGTTVEAALSIEQTATRISVGLTTASSTSESVMAMALAHRPHTSGLIMFDYANEPRTLGPDSLRHHLGHASLTLSADGKSLKGEYRTEASRGNSGRMEFRLVLKR